MRTARTLLEQKIRERRLTYEEFVEYAESFARDHQEPGTLSLRHLQRLAAGPGPKGQPLPSLRPATARLLEHIFDLSIEELLAPPPAPLPAADDSAADLHQMLQRSSQIDSDVITILQEQVDGIRRLDRRLGSIVVHDEVEAKINQVTDLLTHSLSVEVREPLAALLSELCCLAGWQALDLGRATEAWQHYERAKTAALESRLPPFEVHAAAGQAFVLIDIGKTKDAADILTTTREKTDQKCPRLMRAWIAAAHGETLAADGRRDDSLRAFDAAATLLPTDTTTPEGPYVALNAVHLTRWRGHALARVADPEAIDVLTYALTHLDATFTRAETGLRVDLATALAAIGERVEARTQAEHAHGLATQIGSVRQQRRMRKLSTDTTDTSEVSP